MRGFEKEGAPQCRRRALLLRAVAREPDSGAGWSLWRRPCAYGPVNNASAASASGTLAMPSRVDTVTSPAT